jgi:hypothetical protein
MASIKGKRIVVLFVIIPLVFFFFCFVGGAIHWVIPIIGLFVVTLIIVIAQKMRCPRCGIIVDLLKGIRNKNLFINPLLCESCGYNFNEDVGKARKKKESNNRKKGRKKGSPMKKAVK